MPPHPLPPEHRVFVALDTTDIERAENLSQGLRGRVGGIKIGKEFFTAHGPQGVSRVRGGHDGLFVDLKYHDIPNTVAGAVRASLAMRPTIVNVHAGGGAAMMRAAAAAAAEAGENRPLMIAVTVLTSLGADDLRAVGIEATPEEQVLRLAALAQACGLDGVVCSAREVTALRQHLGSDFTLVTPGIRPEWAASDDQKRIVTPREALDMGADYLVIGRPITAAPNPAQAAARIAAELAA
ncbi:orotidine-5'-phosphate decarboxylase [Varunaivibrio sulfuroxidans]|uniref:Orotidine 5'-phosphate decarboxylase n=1 Tax=Varunaivibrio sulfuroxidans TaxID=1773489 RepID=A0A4R3J845_9PROT|nr:orotidine-5'-phosphate decarboxylase [Varunaivibrio sulfuroxidans]TCS61632.1 orotidine-5'-phosphate decarboxylase [Varunaivibrio sulfuroxidans]WES29496.1 orotidine-5'-phosphate decarboxylase [Varunaivibrio sulfuroxidans]